MASSSSNVAASKKRVFLFDLSEKEVSQPTKKVAFCDRQPSLPKCPNEIRAEDLRSARAAMQTVIDGLWRNPQLAVPCSTWLQNRLESESRPKGEGYFQSVPTVLKLLDAEFVSSFLVKHSSITMQSLEAVAVFDPDSPP